MPQIPEPIQWHEGMLLMPQHFQQTAMRYETLIQRTVAGASPFPWGVLQLEYDKSSLVSGLLRVLYVEAVMRDGFAIVAGSQVGTDLEINIKDLVGQMRTAPLTVYLTVPAQNSLSTRGDLARYTSHDGESILDETNGEDPVPIPRLRPRVGLWGGDLPPARFQSLPLLQLKAENDAIQEQEYVSPCIFVPLSSRLGVACTEALRVVRTKSILLAGEIGATTRDTDAASLRAKVLALSSGLPAVEAALKSERAHPFTLYILMCQLAGQIAAITPSLLCPEFPPYRHDDLWRTFQPVLSFITGTAAAALIETWTAIPFEIVGDRFEVGPSGVLDRALREAGTLDQPSLVMAVRVPAGATAETAWKWGEGCVIGTGGAMPTLLSNRVAGALRKRVVQLPGLAPQPGMALLALAFDEPVTATGESLQLVERFVNERRPEQAILFIRRAAHQGDA